MAEQSSGVGDVQKPNGCTVAKQSYIVVASAYTIFRMPFVFCTSTNIIINCVAELKDHLALKLTYRLGNSIFFDEFKSIIKRGPMRYFWATTRLLKPISRGARSNRNLRPENHDSISTCFFLNIFLAPKSI